MNDKLLKNIPYLRIITLFFCINIFANNSNLLQNKICDFIYITAKDNHTILLFEIVDIAPKTDELKNIFTQNDIFEIVLWEYDEQKKKLRISLQSKTILNNSELKIHFLQFGFQNTSYRNQNMTIEEILLKIEQIEKSEYFQNKQNITK